MGRNGADFTLDREKSISTVLIDQFWGPYSLKNVQICSPEFVAIIVGFFLVKHINLMATSAAAHGEALNHKKSCPQGEDFLGEDLYKSIWCTMKRGRWRTVLDRKQSTTFSILA